MFMKFFQNVTFDPDVNACYISVNDKRIVDTIESEPDCWVDVADDHSIVGIEILNANQHFSLINNILMSYKPVEQCVSY
jgi:uncharacterized protein YuzE